MTPEQRMQQIERLGNTAFEHAMTASRAGKLYEESLALYIAACIQGNETEMERQRVAAHQAVDELLDARHLIQLCTNDQKKLMG